MKKIDLETWARRAHYEFFRGFQKPFFDVAARVDMTKVVEFAKTTDRSLFAVVMHIALQAANATPAFRLRFRGDEVFEVDTCHASFTFMGEAGVFNYATAHFDDDIDAFGAGIRKAAQENQARTDINLDDDHRLQLVYITSMPWLDFQSITHAFSGDPDDCFPRIAWGRISNHGTDDDPRFETTLQVTAHHALVDGLHAARYFQNFEEIVARL